MLSYNKDIKALEFLKTFEGESINRLTGNVVIFNQDIASYAVGLKYIVVYKDVKSMSYYWNRFKLYIILTIFLIGITFLYYISLICLNLTKNYPKNQLFFKLFIVNQQC